MYRSDHDAALARIAALEAETIRLQAEIRELRATEVPGKLRGRPAPSDDGARPVPRVRKAAITAAVVLPALAAVFGAVLAVRVPDRPAAAATERGRVLRIEIDPAEARSVGLGATRDVVTCQLTAGGVLTGRVDFASCR